MRQQYILYAVSTPFAGYLCEWGTVDVDAIPDGTTVYEYVQRRLGENTNLALHLFDSPVTISETVRETKKFDPVSGMLVNQVPADITPAEQRVIMDGAKNQAIVANLPSWTQVSNAVDGISNLADAKAFLKKLARVVYWLAKNSEV